MTREMLVWAAILAMAPSSAGAVQLGEVVQGYAYYNRPNATLEQHNSELGACMNDTAPPRAEVAPRNGLVFDLIWSGPVAGLAAIKVENCMVVKGWRVARLEPAAGAKLAALPPAELARALEPMIGAAEPTGEIVRSWRNEALHPAEVKLVSKAKPPGKQQLSWRVLKDSGFVPEPGPIFEPWPKWDKKWPSSALMLMRNLKPTEVGMAPAGSALIVAKISGISNSHGTGVGFERVGASPEIRASKEDGEPDATVAGAGLLFAKKQGNWAILAVPPGRWRISGSGFLAYCMGSPSFEVRADEVVYAGAFDLKGAELGPDLDLAPAQAYLGDPLAAKLRPAVYENGARGDCNVISNLYALEFPNAPFLQDYKWGTKALP